MRNWQPLGEKSYRWLLTSRLGRNQSSGFRNHRFPFFLSFFSLFLPPSLLLRPSGTALTNSSPERLTAATSQSGL